MLKVTHSIHLFPINGIMLWKFIIICSLLFTAQLFIFYAVFYAVLAAMFAICMQGLFRSLSDTEPTWKLHKSMIGTNPGLGYRPQSENETERGSIIQFDSKKNAEKEFWINLLNEFLTGRCPRSFIYLSFAFISL